MKRRNPAAALPRVLFALGAMLATGCSPGAVSPFPQNTRAVFAAERARQLVRQCSRASPGPVEGVWTPADSDLNALEDALPSLIQSELRARWPNYQARAFDYYRQYGGLVIAGQRIIYVNAFDRRLLQREPAAASDPSHSWRDAAVLVCDGGPVVFGVEFNPRTREFARFEFNGAID